MSIKVKPGTARVPKSSDQDILATLVNFDAQMVPLFVRPLGSKNDWQGQAMEPAKATSDYRYSIFNIQDSIEYFVESNGVRSDVFKLTVVDLPYVKQLDLTLNFPAFTHLPAKTMEDGGDIAALERHSRQHHRPSVGKGARGAHSFSRRQEDRDARRWARILSAT